MNLSHSLSLLGALLAPHPSNSFIPSRPTTPSRCDHPGTFQFYAEERQRRIDVHFDQHISVRKAVQGEDEDGDAVGKEEEPRELPVERRRKRDILKRTFGIGVRSPSKTDVSGSNTSGDNAEEQIVFRKEGEIPELPNFLTLQDEEQLNATYAALKEAGFKKVEEEFQSGAFGGDVTLEEARKIVEYTVEQELQSERKKLNEQRSIETLEQYDEEADKMEEKMVNDILSEGDDKILDKDPIAREIITDILERKRLEDEDQEQRDALKSYEKELSEKEQELIISRTKEILENNPDPDLDVNTVYEQVVAGIQKSRREKLSRPTYGVLGNTIELEEAREYGIRAREEEERDKAAREEALAKGYCDEEGLEDFFDEPTEVTEVKMFQSIVTSIVEKRPPSLDTVVPKASFVENDEDVDEEAGEGNDEGIESIPPVRFYDPDEAKKKWTLSASEKVEAFRLFNLWRDFESDRSKMEQALKPEGDRPTNKIEPLFLYVEDSKRTRKWENDQLEQALRLQLQTDDDVEKSSNDLLMKELLEGGYTKERSLRLVDKLISKASDGVIKDALKEMKLTLLEEEEEEPEVKKESPKKPLFVDLSNVFTRDDDEFKRPPKQVKRDSDVKTMPSWVADDKKWRRKGVESLDEDEDDDDLPDQIVAKPKTSFFESTFDKNATTDEIATTSKLLGSYEEQLFEKLAAQAGVKTEEEKAELKRNLDEIEALRARRLSDIEERDVASESARLGIDVNRLNLDDENSEEIMALLGKRPSRRPEGDSTVVDEQKPRTKPSTPEDTAKPHEIVAGSDGTLHEMDDLSEADIISQQYRAITGGQTEDEAQYREFLKQEEEMLKLVENEPVKDLPIDFDVDTYADTVLSEMKPRPQVSEKDDGDEVFMSLEQMDDEKRRLELAFDEDDAEYETMLERDSPPGSGQPDWLRLERDSRGVRRQDLNDDRKVDGVERQKEIEERQKLADKYLEEQSGGIIDIAEVLDRPYFGSMDEPDDYKKKYSTFSGYQARKDELMQYTTLTVEDIINVVDWKRDPASTGVNPYLLQVQRPFSEYGALFRLEGCIVDLLGLQVKAWQKVAEKFGYTIRSEDQVKKASLYPPEKAVRVVFLWTDDIIELEEIAKTHRSEFNNAFNTWFENDRTFVYPKDSTRRNNSNSNKSASATAATPRPSKDEIYTTYTLAWNRLAREKGQTPPSMDEVMKGIAIRDWEVAIKDVFGWNEYSAQEIYDIVVEYDKILQEDFKRLNEKYGLDYAKEKEGSASEDAASSSATVATPRPSKDEIYTTYTLAWTKVAREKGKTPPSIDEVTKGIAIRDWEVAIKDIFGWNEYNSQEIYDIVVEYDKILQTDIKTMYAKYGLDYGNDGSESWNKYPALVLQEGVTDWLESLRSVDMPVAVMSHLERSQLEAVLDVTGLADYFPPSMRVCLDDRYSDERSELLGAALRVEKHPDRCVVFDNAPSSAEVAHDVFMKCVSFVNHYPKYELLAADWTIGEYRNLDLSSIRTLFMERDDTTPLAVADYQSTLRRQPPQTKTSFWDEGDR